MRRVYTGLAAFLISMTLGLFPPVAAQAQNASVNATCSARVYAAGDSRPLTVNLTGDVCINGSLTLGASELHLGEVGGHTTIVGSTFTSTATTTALSDGQLYANSATAGSVAPLAFTTACRTAAGTGMVRRARIKSADSGFAGKILLLKLYRDSPTPTNGDHAAWLTTESNFIGEISVTLNQHFSDPYEKGIGVPAAGNEINFDCAAASTTIYGLLVSSGISGTLQGSKLTSVVLEEIVN